MTATSLRHLALCVSIVLLAASGVQADEVRAKDAGATGVRPPILAPGSGDLLPFSDLERQDFNKQHGVLVYRLKALERKIGQLGKQAHEITEFLNSVP